MSKVYFVTDVETTGPDFSYHNMYQFASVPVLQDGTVLEGAVYDVDFDPARGHDQDTLDFLKRDLQIIPETLRARETKIAPAGAMLTFNSFVRGVLRDVGATKPLFVADNLAFDWGFIHTYFHQYLSKNPFGYAGRNIPCLSAGFYGSRKAWEEFITEPHTHDALDDTRGNAGAFAKMLKDGLKV